MKFILSLLCTFFLGLLTLNGQDSIVVDNFEGNGTINQWQTEAVSINVALPNPVVGASNNSATVLEYKDQGGQWANIFFDINNFYKLRDNYIFSFKIYIPSNSLTGNSPNQVSLKLQNKHEWAAWATQTEIIKPVVLDQWQTISFDFLNDPYMNLDAGSPPPTTRFDFNRVMIQINGENNNDQVTAYIDDFNYDGVLPQIEDFTDLVWADEFDDDGSVNATKWHHQTQLPNAFGWHNGEIQHYTDRVENSSVNNGILSITAKRESYSDQGLTTSFTSARLNSKFAFQYGKVVIRAKMPTGGGTWPALWMLGKNIDEDGGYWDNLGFGNTGWPACGEIDIIEHWGDNQGYLQSAMHTPSSHGSTVNRGGRFADATIFHDYELIWTDKQIMFSIDGIRHYIYDPLIRTMDTWPFDAEQYLLMNFAILPWIDSAFTQAAMEVDYVRVYQNVLDTGLTDTTLLVENIQNTRWIDLYPNPVKQDLQIFFHNDESDYVFVEIYDLARNSLINQENRIINGKISSLSLNQLQAGAYIVELRTKHKTYRKRFLKL